MYSFISELSILKQEGKKWMDEGGSAFCYWVEVLSMCQYCGGSEGDGLPIDLESQGKFLHLWVQGHNSDSSFPLGTALDGDKVAGRESKSNVAKYGYFWALQRDYQLYSGERHRWKEYRSFCSGCWAPSHYSCSPSQDASCIHVFKETQPNQNGLNTHTHTHKEFSVIFSASYGSLCCPIKEKKSLYT